jgi:hypothetical protein
MRASSVIAERTVLRLHSLFDCTFGVTLSESLKIFQLLKKHYEFVPRIKSKEGERVSG